MAIHFVKKQARWPLFFIAFLKGSKHNYQLNQVLENFKYSFYFDGITLNRWNQLSLSDVDYQPVKMISKVKVQQSIQVHL